MADLTRRNLLWLEVRPVDTPEMSVSKLSFSLKSQTGRYVDTHQFVKYNAFLRPPDDDDPELTDELLEDWLVEVCCTTLVVCVCVVG